MILTQRAFVEAMAHLAGRHLADCNTNDKRDSALGLLEKFSTHMFVKDRYFSIERFNDRVLAVEERFRKAIKDGWTGEPFTFEGVFNARKKVSTKRRVPVKSGDSRRKRAK